MTFFGPIGNTATRGCPLAAAEKLIDPVVAQTVYADIAKNASDSYARATASQMYSIGPGTAATPLPASSSAMSFQLAIPRRTALQQGPLPLHQPYIILR